MYKYIVYHITIYKDNEYYRYEQKKIPTTSPKDIVGKLSFFLNHSHSLLYPKILFSFLQGRSSIVSSIAIEP